jgi:hypothetical protein
VTLKLFPYVLAHEVEFVSDVPHAVLGQDAMVGWVGAPEVVDAGDRVAPDTLMNDSDGV